jgi:hypothetical protein
MDATILRFAFTLRSWPIEKNLMIKFGLKDFIFDLIIAANKYYKGTSKN